MLSVKCLAAVEDESSPSIYSVKLLLEAFLYPPGVIVILPSLHSPSAAQQYRAVRDRREVLLLIERHSNQSRQQTLGHARTSGSITKARQCTP